MGVDRETEDWKSETKQHLHIKSPRTLSVTYMGWTDDGWTCTIPILALMVQLLWWSVSGDTNWPASVRPRPIQAKSLPLTYKPVLPYNLEGQLVGKDGGVAMGDVGKWPGVYKHWGTLQATQLISHQLDLSLTLSWKKTCRKWVHVSLCVCVCVCVYTCMFEREACHDK